VVLERKIAVLVSLQYADVATPSRAFPHGYAVKEGERAGTLDNPREISLGRGTSFNAGVIFYFISIWTIGFLVFLFFGSVDLSGKSKMKFIFFGRKGGGGWASLTTVAPLFPIKALHPFWLTRRTRKFEFKSADPAISAAHAKPMETSVASADPATFTASADPTTSAAPAYPTAPAEPATLSLKIILYPDERCCKCHKI
jgi:hypothetical protein